jgi:outer membrane protein assembly factor BamB
LQLTDEVGPFRPGRPDSSPGELGEKEVDPYGSPTSVVVTEGAVYVASDTELTCVRYPTGEVVWSRKTRASGRATLLLAADRLFLARDGEVECFSVEGEPLWHDAFEGREVRGVA